MFAITRSSSLMLCVRRAIPGLPAFGLALGLASCQPPVPPAPPPPLVPVAAAKPSDEAPPPLPAPRATVSAVQIFDATSDRRHRHPSSGVVFVNAPLSAVLGLRSPVATSRHLAALTKARLIDRINDFDSELAAYRAGTSRVKQQDVRRDFDRLFSDITHAVPPGDKHSLKTIVAQRSRILREIADARPRTAWR